MWYWIVMILLILGCAALLGGTFMTIKKNKAEDAMMRRTGGHRRVSPDEEDDEEEDYDEDYDEEDDEEEEEDEEEYEEEVRQILLMMMAEATAAFEKLPCLLDAEILRNILYRGVWAKYEKVQKERQENKENHGK